MTQPTETPADPITEVEQPAPNQQPTPPTDPAKPDAPAQGTDWKAESRKWEQRAKDNTKAAEAEKTKLAGVLKALGLKDDGTEDIKPEDITARLEQANHVAWQRGVKLQVVTLAGRHAANAEALLDSMSFINSLDDLVDDDPDSVEFATKLESKIKQAVKDNPRYAANTGPKKSGPPIANGGDRAQPKSKTLEEAFAAHYGTG